MNQDLWEVCFQASVVLEEVVVAYRYPLYGE